MDEFIGFDATISDHFTKLTDQVQIPASTQHAAKSFSSVNFN